MRRIIATVVAAALLLLLAPATATAGTPSEPRPWGKTGIVYKKCQTVNNKTICIYRPIRHLPPRLP